MPDDFIMDDVNCGGSKNTLLDCDYTKYDNCGPTEGAGVVCSDPLSKCRVRSITTILFDENYLHLGTVIV